MAGARGAGAGGRGAGADLRERRRVGPRDRRLRGDAGATPRSRCARSSCCRASPRSRSGGCRTRTRRSRPTGARCASTRPTRTCSAHLRAAGRPRPGTGPSWRRCYAAELEKLEDTRRAGRHAAAPRARLRGGDRPARRGDRHLPARRRRRARQQATRSSRSIACISRAQQWDELADVVRREIRIAPTDEAIVALHVPPRRRSTSWRCVDMPKADRGLPRDPEGRSDATPRRAPRSSGCSWAARMQLEIADVLEPLYRVGRGVGEAAPDLRGAARRA